ncbi:MAG: tRNA (adenosine(37)-N6)-threonylcarbamoyltransferase complex ATPase subunit type 1 TsaE [Acidobacteria bacterium]|nr:MAG: tRNA (adenosine(37)-N6)-threonylcarbamoyltransferase complex ATPase subunit type 1 TsaE [Acidobacteriota bacterium]
MMCDGELKNYISNSVEETLKIGKKLAHELRGDEIILLSGGLGSGKTLITKGIVSSLGFDENEVNSPSFTLMNIYETEKTRVYHIDLWRLDDVDEIMSSIGLDEMILEPAVIVIEWAEKLGRFSFGARKIIEIKIEGEGVEPRKIIVKNHDV